MPGYKVLLQAKARAAKGKRPAKGGKFVGFSTHHAERPEILQAGYVRGGSSDAFTINAAAKANRRTTCRPRKKR